MRKPTKRPNLPPPQDPRFLEAVRESLQNLLGERGDRLDRAVSFRDLLDSGIAKAAAKLGNRVPTGGDPLDYIEPSNPPPVLTRPHKPTGLKVSGGVMSALITWDNWRYENHSYTEIARSPSADFGQMAIMGWAPSRSYADTLPSSGDWYYWARHVSKSGVEGPWAGPVKATVSSTAEEVVDNIEGQIDKSMLVDELVTPIERAEQIGGEYYAKTVTIGSKKAIGGYGLAIENGASVFAVAADKVFFVDPDATTEFDDQADYASTDDLFATNFIFGYASINGSTRFAINVPAAIPQATIDFAQIDVATINDLNVTQKATIRNATLEGVTNVFDLIVGTGGVIESENYVQGSSGFRLTEAGFLEARGIDVSGTVRGSQILGGTIEGAKVTGGLFLQPTDLDLAPPNDFTYLAKDTTLTFKQSVAIPRNSWTGAPIDIVSANNSDTSNYRRFRRQFIDLKGQYRFLENGRFSFLEFRVRNVTTGQILLGPVEIRIDYDRLEGPGGNPLYGTGDGAQHYDGGFLMTLKAGSGTTCNTVMGNVRCTEYEYHSGLDVEVTGLDFNGDGLIAFEIWRGQDYSYPNDNWEWTVTAVAENDY